MLQRVYLCSGTLDMVAGVTGNFSVPNASNFREVPKILTHVLSKVSSYTYDPSPNLKNYVKLGQLITEWKQQNTSRFKGDPYGAFKNLIDLVTQGKEKNLMQRITSSPISVSPTFEPEIIKNLGNGRVVGTTFTAKLK